MPSSFVSRTQARFLNGILSTAAPQILSHIPRIPPSTAEVKESILYRYEGDGKRCFLALERSGSISRTPCLESGLTRAIIKSALLELSYNRRLQVTPASILVGTRFKFFDTSMVGKSVRLPTVCRLCGEKDTPAHLLKHAGINPGDTVAFLVKIAAATDVINPHISQPYLRDVAEEIELDEDGSEARSQASIDSLSFDADPPVNGME